MSIPRMRTAAGVLALIKEQDPGTEITLHFIRRIINSGSVAVINAGTKKLVDADAVIAYISAGNSIQDKAERTGPIRKVQI